MLNLQEWKKGLMAGETIPFAVVEDDTECVFLLRSCTLEGESEGEVLLLEYVTREPLLEAYLSIFLDYSLEFATLSIRIKATGSSASMLRNFRILRIAMPVDGLDGSPRLAGMTGGFFDFNRRFPPTSLSYWEKEVSVDEVLEIDSGPSGRSSNLETPLWALNAGCRSAWFAPEWSGCWRFELQRFSSSICASLILPTLDFQILPGEEIALPSASFGVCAGGIDNSLNRLRAVIRSLLPDIGADRPIPPVVFQGLGGLPRFQDEENLYREAERAANLGCEAFVLDAGWYNAPENDGWGWANTLGKWTPSAARFPHGIERFAEHVHNLGMRFGLWFEPRVRPDAECMPEVQSFVIHPRRLDGTPAGDEMCLLDLSIQAACDWLVRLLERFITEYKADWIWFDFNTDPRIVYWDAHEPVGRRGLMELGFYKGLYGVFERINKCHPDVWLETCASGGRCIDLGMLRRFHSIWIQDDSWDDDMNRNFRGAANRFLPAVCIQNALFILPEARAKTEGTPYSNLHFLTHFAGAMQFGQGLVFWNDEDLGNAARYGAIYRQYRKYLEKDFYALLPAPASKNAWDGWQYHDPVTGSGIAIIFRLDASEQDAQEIRLRGVGKDSQVSITILDGHAKINPSPEDPAIFTIALAQGQAALLQYAPQSDLELQSNGQN